MWGGFLGPCTQVQGRDRVHRDMAPIIWCIRWRLWIDICVIHTTTTTTTAKVQTWTAGLQEPVTHFSDDGIVPGRLVAGIVTLLDGVAIAVASGYWFSSQGLKECNLRLFSVVCQFASATTLDVIVGGDFQVEPALAQNLECFAMSGLVLKAADRDKTTCTSKFGGRCIDWFLMSASVGAAVDQISVRKEAFTRPHSPVCVTFKPRLSLLKKLVMDAPQKIAVRTNYWTSQTFAWCFEGRKVGAGCVAICQMRSFMGQRRSGAGGSLQGLGQSVGS